MLSRLKKMASPKNNLSNEDRERVIAIAQSIIDMSETPGFKHYARAVEALIDNMTPEVSEVPNGDAAIALASKLAFVSGMKRALKIPNQQKDILNNLQ
jgi:hypothetical protein